MRGKSLRSRMRCLPTEPPATTRVTATIISTIPVAERGVSFSPNTVIPMITAVTGSSAPGMAGG